MPSRLVDAPSAGIDTSKVSLSMTVSVGGAYGRRLDVQPLQDVFIEPFAAENDQSSVYANS
jgi:hypothetical protein